MNISKLNDFDKGWVIVTKYFHQYTWGITGATSALNIYLNTEAAPFKTKKEALTAVKAKGWKRIHKRGEDTGYGEVGAKTFDIEYMRVANARQFSGCQHPFPSLKCFE